MFLYIDILLLIEHSGDVSPEKKRLLINENMKLKSLSLKSRNVIIKRRNVRIEVTIRRVRATIFAVNEQ